MILVGKLTKTASRGDFPHDFKVIWDKVTKVILKLISKMILVAKMEQNCFQMAFSGKSHPKSDFKVILTVISK